MEELRAALKNAAFSISHEEQLYNRWNSRAGGRDRRQYASLPRAMLALATPEVKAVIEPKGDGPQLTFRL